jgi:signal transduction histidine kinase
MIRRLRRVPWAVWDVLLALVLIGATAGELLGMADASAAMWLGALMISGSVLLRRSEPFAAVGVWIAGLILMVAFHTSPSDLSSPFLTLFILPYSTAQRLDRGKAVFTLALMWLGVVLVYLGDDQRVWGDIFFPGMFATGFWAAGRLVRSRSRLTAELHEAAVSAAEHQEAELARAAAEERRRIAREMHDVVAHSVSMMVVQAGGARRILDRDPERAIAAAELIERTGREALTEMRRLLGVFHADDASADYAPQPSLRELEALVERARVAGLQVDLTVEGRRRELPAGLDLAAYRVVQEALTNVLKHGGGAPTEVEVHYRADAVEVRIADRGNGALNVRLGGSGQGLVGMRERVRMYGGELHADRRRGGGFEVRATLPLEAGEEAALTAGARA